MSMRFRRRVRSATGWASRHTPYIIIWWLRERWYVAPDPVSCRWCGFLGKVQVNQNDDLDYDEELIEFKSDLRRSPEILLPPPSACFKGRMELYFDNGRPQIDRKHICPDHQPYEPGYSPRGHLQVKTDKRTKKRENRQDLIHVVTVLALIAAVVVPIFFGRGN